MSLRKQLIQEAEAAWAGLRKGGDDIDWIESTNAVIESHSRLLAFIKGQKWQGAVFGQYTYTNPETLP